MNFPSELIFGFFFFDAPGPNRVIQDNSLAGYIPEVKSSLLFFWVWEEGGGRREEEGGNRHPRDNVPCSSLAEAVN